ncbi:hypothetical protein SKAU_G00026510 [Synaphobranchus kaupii]|uniref:Uncharacterized protein n=1 Tax=Synaphobranchus kaupii TaxID=118154 RepID=A0A9Q1GE27_SYNKA|nr:hypothetical protein SKAU_G00026510 [Synaphobranchus kaupii]
MELELSTVYDTLRVSAEDALSAGQIQSVYYRVFHTPVSQQDTLRAVRKVTGDNKETSCHAGKILDVLLEIEKENALKEELYWESQMLSAGILTGKYADSSGMLSMPCSYEQPQDQSQDREHFQGGCTQDQRAQSSVYVYRLRKDVRRICSRFSKEGLQHALPSIYYGVKSVGPAGPHELWSPCTDLLQHIDDKYDFIRQKLCTEMLQDHYGKLPWEALLPWQQKERVEELAAWAECALDSADLLQLSALPGAFRLYRSRDRVALRLCPEKINPEVLQWTAALSLKELHSCHQLEKRGLAAVMKRCSLDVTSLRRLSLYVQVTVMRAENEKHSHGALLAGSQSWGSWPDVLTGPHCRDLVRFWLGEQSTRNSSRRAVTFCHCSPQQAVLWCILSCQECEREHLIELVHSLTPEELQGPVVQSSQSMGIVPEHPSALRQPCIVRLREIKVALKGAVSWGDCALGVLTQLMKLQDAEVMALIQDLQEASNDYLIELRDKYTAELQAQKMANLFLLLLPDSCQHSRPMGNSDNAESSASEESISARLLRNGEAREIPQETRGNVEGEHERPAVGSDRRELCSVCRHSLVPEEIPYLEVLRDRSNQEEPYGERAVVEGEAGPCDVPLYFEKQGSLIAVAWGKPAEDANDQITSDELLECEAAPSLKQEECSPCAAGHQDEPDQEDASAGKVTSDELVECEAAPSLKQEEVSNAPHQMASEDAGEDEASGSAFFQCSPCAAGHQDEPDQEDSSAGKLPLYEAPVEDKGEGELNGERRDPQRPTDNNSNFSECSQLAGDIQDRLSEEAIYTSSPSGPTTTHETRSADKTDEDDNDRTVEEASKESHSDIATDSIFDKCSEKLFQEHPIKATSAGQTGTKGYRREATIVHISDMEREETMKSLVDMQRKTESKYQRDKERQMFRIQERLSIIQNKKSEEDLLGHRQGDSFKELTENIKQEDRHRQKTLVKEKLEQLRRERSHVMQSKRDRNTTGFKELLDPVVLHRPEQEDIVNSKC